MEALLKHLIDITCQRDHVLLDNSVVTALHELVGATQVRVHEIISFRGVLYLRPRTWLENGRVVSADELPWNTNSGRPMSDFPALVEAIGQRKNSAELREADDKHVLWVPIWLNDKVSSCLEIVNSTPYSEATRHMLEGILCVYRNYQSLLDYSERDSLTGLLNRKTFDEKFSRLLIQSQAESAPVPENDRRQHAAEGMRNWLAVVDIDHFKHVNDRFGHLYGDEVLILVANLLRQSFRSQDRVFRFGGEEFVVLLRGTTLTDARRIFERFRANVEQHEFPQVGRVTVSVGFASIANESPVVILGHADRALYYAKENGRNRVCYYDELVESGELRSEYSNAEVEFF